MVQCSRCRNQVDETTRKTCPTCLTPLPMPKAQASASPASTPTVASPSATPSAIPVAVPKSQPPPAQGGYAGANPAPGYAPVMPQNAPPAPGYAPQPGYGGTPAPGYAPTPGYAPQANAGYAPQPGAGLPPYPGAQQGAGLPPYPGATPAPNGYVPQAYGNRQPMPSAPAKPAKSSGGSGFGTTFPWWRLCFVVSAIGRGVYWGTHSHQTTTSSYTPTTTNIGIQTPAPAYNPPTYARPAYTPTYAPQMYTPPTPSYRITPPTFSSGPYGGYGASHFTPPPMPTPHFGPGPRFGR